MDLLDQLSFENEPINIHFDHFLVHQLVVVNRFTNKVQEDRSFDIEMSGANKEMEEFKKIWDKGIVYLKSFCFRILHQTHFKTRWLSVLHGFDITFPF